MLSHAQYRKLAVPIVKLDKKADDIHYDLKNFLINVIQETENL